MENRPILLQLNSKTKKDTALALKKNDDTAKVAFSFYFSLKFSIIKGIKIYIKNFVKLKKKMKHNFEWKIKMC
jgi:hypothetical protein